MRTAITFSKQHDGHALEGHFERPERIHAVVDLLERDGALDTLSPVAAPPAELDDVLLVHPISYYHRLESTKDLDLVWLDPDTYARADSINVAMEALGGLLSITRSVASRDVHNGFAVVRPPGHHARRNEAMGFCLLANVSIAAEWVKKHYGVERILIVDFDVHHGNGTQEIFYQDPNVLYVSTHQYPLYPGTGALHETGLGRGKGATINIPLPAQTGDTAYQKVFERILRPLVLEFDPEFIFVSAGYDAHWLDPIGGMNLSITGFSAIVREILSWSNRCASDRLVALLEGGYHAQALAHCVLTTIRLLGDSRASPSDPLGPSDALDNDQGSMDEYLRDLAAAFGLNEF